MKVTGPGSGPGASGAPDGASNVDATEAGRSTESTATGTAGDVGRAGKSFAERLAAGTAPAARGAAQADAPTKVGELAADLVAGRISPSAAVDQVVQQILDRQLGTNAPAAVRAKVETALRDALETDPLLGDKLKRLGG